VHHIPWNIKFIHITQHTEWRIFGTPLQYL
jgi:hypothetical protein